MRIDALQPYESSLTDAGQLALLAADGRSIVLEIDRYLAECDDADRSVLDRCTGPVLDIGCGPGRIVQALTERGVAALGVDIASTAVELTRLRGGAALNRDLFARIPGEGRWPTALVLDGNVGIGGDAGRLLERLGAVLSPSGRAVVETDPDDAADEQLCVRFAMGGVAMGPEFGWSVVGADALLTYGAPLGFYASADWSLAGRRFIELARRPSRMTLTA